MRAQFYAMEKAPSAMRDSRAAHTSKSTSVLPDALLLLHLAAFENFNLRIFFRCKSWSSVLRAPNYHNLRTFLHSEFRVKELSSNQSQNQT
ncbi:hypothetical protein HRR82_006944 [Exophiala dermatitidis]|nr:hypothetical protein HRR82_006944 [Exophiala dermatitidis]